MTDISTPITLNDAILHFNTKHRLMLLSGNVFAIRSLMHIWIWGIIRYFLLMYLQNKLLYFGLGRMAEMGKVSLSEEEEQLLSGFAAARQRGHGTFGGTKEQTMAQVYEMFVRHGILSDTLDHEQILVGKSKRGIATLGMIFRSPYAKREIKPEYYELLSYLFDNKQLNIRNCIMHGNSVTYDYLQIGISAVMLQLLWDIANDDIFIS